MQRRLTNARVAGALIAGGLLAAVGLPGSQAGADSAADWVITARAGAADLGIVTTGGFIVDRIDPGGALAYNHVETATAQSSSLASAPYPSEIGEQGPGLLYGVLQNTLPYNGIPVPDLPIAPAWPWTVRASANGADPPQATLGDATSPFRLKSTAGEREAGASADAGGAQPGAFALMHLQATSTVNAKEAGKAALTAASKVENLVIGDALRIGEVRTELELKRSAGGQPEPIVRRSITGVSVGGVAAELRPEGFVFQGTTTPLPAPLLQGLRSAGIEVEVGAVEKVEGGVRAKGLTVRMPFDFSGMSDDKFPFSTPHTMTVELSFATVLGSIEQVGIDRPLPDYTSVASEPVTAGSSTNEPALSSSPVADKSDAPASPAHSLGWSGAGRAAGAARAKVTEVADLTGVAGADAPVTETYETAATPVPFQPAALSAPAGIAGREARDEMGQLGWIAQGAAIAFVVLLVAGRARRAVGAK